MLRKFFLIGLLPVVLSVSGCSSAQSQAMGPKTWLLRCESGLAGCANRAKQLCREQGYWIVRGHSYSFLAGIEGNQVEEGEHQMVIECGMPPDEQRGPVPGRREAATDKAPDPKSRAKELLGTQCLPGETQECVGPGACRGGQRCIDSGSGFSPCDCGAQGSSSSVPLPAEPAASAATDTEEGTSPPTVASPPTGTSDAKGRPSTGNAGPSKTPSPTGVAPVPR